MNIQNSLPLFLILMFASCSSSSGDSGGGNKNPTASQSPQPGQQGTGQQENQNSSNQTGTAGQATDVIVVSAIGPENAPQATQLSSNLTALLTGLTQKAASNPNIHIALIANPVAPLSGVRALLTGPNSLQINFELAPKDAFIGSLVAGCAPTASVIDSTHAAGTITVCSASVAIPAHSWSWAVEDLKGKLLSFLRPAANRVYIFVSSNDPTIISAQQFQTIAKSQATASSVKAFAIAPQGATGLCNAQNLAVSILSDVASQTSGRMYSFCQADWTSYTAGILQFF